MTRFRAKYQGISTIHGEEISLTTNVNGDINWTFPTPFPTDIITAHVSPADPATAGMYAIKVWPKSSGFTSRTQVSIRVYDMAGVALGTFSLKVNVTAFGY